MRKRNRLRWFFAQPNFSYSHISFLILFLSYFLILSCSTPDDIFLLKGKFKNFNQGELYIYSQTGKGRIDTVRLAEGKFSYDLFLDDTLVLSVVFPNYSEIPVIAMPGTSVNMEGDASHLKEVSVKGTSENNELTAFRLQISTQTPPEAKKSAAAFIKEHPSSPACLYLLNKYFLLMADANYEEAAQLLELVTKANPGKRRLNDILSQIRGLSAAKAGKRLPRFTAVTTNGARVTQSDLQGTMNVISVWATWNYESQSQQRELKKLKKEYGSRLQLLSLCLDGNPEECKKQLKHDSISWYTVCDGRMWSGELARDLGISRVPDNILIDSQGKIVGRSLSLDELKKKLADKLK